MDVRHSSRYYRQEDYRLSTETSTERPQRVATMQDIGRELGLSAMTVSRALNGHPDVKEETRQKVLSWAAQRNYRPNRWARSLVTRKSQIVGIVIPDITHNFFSEITRSVQEIIEPAGYDLMLCHTHSDPSRERSAIDTLVGNHVDGLVVASEQPEADPSFFVNLAQGTVPFVLVDRFFPDLQAAQIRADDFQIGKLATEYLISLGHRRIAHLEGPAISPSRLRKEGYLTAMSAAELPVNPAWIVRSDYTYDGGERAMKQLLQLDPAPTAVCSGNDAAAMGAIRACLDAGLNVPRDVSVMGAGSIEGSYHPVPFLTTMDWPRRELGHEAGEMLLRAIRSKEPLAPVERVYQPTLLVRQSTAALL